MLLHDQLHWYSQTAQLPSELLNRTTMSFSADFEHIEALGSRDAGLQHS